MNLNQVLAGPDCLCRNARADANTVPISSGVGRACWADGSITAPRNVGVRRSELRLLPTYNESQRLHHH